MNIEKVICNIESSFSKSKNAVYIIGIDGGSGSGKSFISRKIRRTLKEPSLLITVDNYCIGQKENLKVNNNKVNSSWENPATRDLGRLKRDLLSLKNNRPIMMPTYSMKRSEPLRVSQVEPRKIVIVEGIFALDKRLVDLYDLKIFIDTKEIIRKKRRLKSELEFGKSSMFDIEKYYDRYVSPGYNKYIEPNKKQADILIQND